MEKQNYKYNWGAGIPIGVGIAVAVGLALNNFILGIPVGFVMALAIASAYVKQGKNVSDLPAVNQTDPTPDQTPMDK